MANKPKKLVIKRWKKNKTIQENADLLGMTYKAAAMAKHRYKLKCEDTLNLRGKGLGKPLWKHGNYPLEVTNAKT